MTSQSLHLLRGRIDGLQCWFWTRSGKLGDMKLFLKQVSFARATFSFALTYTSSSPFDFHACSHTCISRSSAHERKVSLIISASEFTIWDAD
jgi:hypothetical protein